MSQIFPNSDFESGTNEACHCPDGYTCYNDAGRVVDGIHPLYHVGDLGCQVDGINNTGFFGAHGGTGYVFFYAGSDQVLTPEIFFESDMIVKMSVWYCGPYPNGPNGQNLSLAHFTLMVDDEDVSPEVLVPTGTPWTRYTVEVLVPAGNHNFSIMSGGSAQYVMWFDDFVIDTCSVPVVELGNDTVLCQGDTFVLNAYYQNANYRWQDNSTDPLFIVSQPGTYWVEVTDSCGTGTDTIIIGQALLPEINLGNDTSLCSGEVMILDATSEGATYIWQDNSTNPTYTVQNSGSFWVEVTNLCGTNTDTIEVLFRPLPDIELGNDTSLCSGETIMLDAYFPGATYIWQDNSSLSYFNVSSEGNYWVEVNAYGCIKSDSIYISYNDAPDIDLGNDTVLCSGESLLLNATTENSIYTWQDHSNDPQFTVMQTGTYWVNVENDCGSAGDTINVDYLNLPKVNLGNDTSLCRGDIIMIDVSSTGTDYLWQDHSNDPIFYISEEGVYWVEVSNLCGIDTDSIIISDGNCNCKIFVPNAFTPDGDGKNDGFLILAKCDFIEYDLKIFDRWGGLIFESKDPNKAWDGRVTGRICEAGTYVYRVSYRFGGNTGKVGVGSVVLVR